MKNNKYIYIHIRLDTNEVFYVGIGTPCKTCTNKENKYYYRRAYTKTGRNIFWKRTVNKTDWEYKILFDNLSLKEAETKEIELISKYGKKYKKEGTLVNLADGGDINSGWNMPEESKNNIRKKMLGRIFTKEHKKRMSENANPALKGKTMPTEYRNKIATSMKGKHKNSKNPFYRKTHSEETKNKWRNSERNIGGNNYASVLVLDLETGIFYETLKEAAEAKNIVYSSLRAYFNPKVNVKNKTSFIKV